jgi:hypothetical protein
MTAVTTAVMRQSRLSKAIKWNGMLGVPNAFERGVGASIRNELAVLLSIVYFYSMNLSIIQLYYL